MPVPWAFQVRVIIHTHISFEMQEKTPMTLFPIREYYRDYEAQINTWKEVDLASYSVCTNGDQIIGEIRDVLVDSTGYFRYLIVEVDFWGQHKSILVPIGLAKFNYDQRQVFIENLNTAKLAELPSYQNDFEIDRNYEQRVRDVFLVTASQRAGRRFLQQPYTVNGHYRGAPSGHTPGSTQDYNHHPTFYGMSDRDNQRPLKNLENRLND